MIKGMKRRRPQPRLTPARTDLPTVGDTIALLHSNRLWYVDRPVTVIYVNPNPPRPLAPQVVVRSWQFHCELYGEHAKRPDGMFETTWEFDSTYPLEWNHLDALTAKERKPIDDYAARVAKCKHIYPTGPWELRA